MRGELHTALLKQKKVGARPSSVRLRLFCLATPIRCSKIRLPPQIVLPPPLLVRADGEIALDSPSASHSASSKMTTLSCRLLPLVATLGLVMLFWQQQQIQSYFSANRPFSSGLDRSSSSSSTLKPPTANTISRRVVAVADLHGDLEHAHNVLRMAGLIDLQETPNWIGQHNILVSTGDIVDRGDDTIALYELFRRLREQAKNAGGAVLNCLGNHEMMNALGDWRYVTPGDIDTFGGKYARREVMSTSGWIGQEWLANFSITHSIPLLEASHLPNGLARSSSYSIPHASFVHGGIHPSWASLGIEHINRVGSSLLFKALDNSSPDGWVPPTATQEEIQFYGEGGPLWNRHYATYDETAACLEARDARRSLKVRHLVMGHTPHLDGFVVRCDSGILLIDTGISRAYGGEQSALVFDTQLRPLGGGVWEEEEVLSALYRGRRPKVLETRITKVHE